MWHSSAQPSIICLVFYCSRYVAFIELIHLDEQRLATSPIFDQSEAKKLSLSHTHTHTQTGRESTYCQALLYEQQEISDIIQNSFHNSNIILLTLWGIIVFFNSSLNKGSPTYSTIKKHGNISPQEWGC